MGQSLAEVCVAADRFDLLERLSQLAEEHQLVQNQVAQWKAGERIQLDAQFNANSWQPDHVPNEQDDEADIMRQIQEAEAREQAEREQIEAEEAAQLQRQIHQ